MTTGSFADVGKDLRKEIENLERLFTIDTAKLKEITNHFVNELEKGLSVKGGSIVSYQDFDEPAKCCCADLQPISP